jgi:hypothetical protein
MFCHRQITWFVTQKFHPLLQIFRNCIVDASRKPLTQKRNPTACKLDVDMLAFEEIRGYHVFLIIPGGRFVVVSGFA